MAGPVCSRAATPNATGPGFGEGGNHGDGRSVNWDRGKNSATHSTPDPPQNGRSGWCGFHTGFWQGGGGGVGAWGDL
jgi:hypothetical protein